MPNSKQGTRMLSKVQTSTECVGSKCWCETKVCKNEQPGGIRDGIKREELFSLHDEGGCREVLEGQRKEIKGLVATEGGRELSSTTIQTGSGDNGAGRGRSRVEVQVILLEGSMLPQCNCYRTALWNAGQLPCSWANASATRRVGTFPIEFVVAAAADGCRGVQGSAGANLKTELPPGVGRLGVDR